MQCRNGRVSAGRRGRRGHLVADKLWRFLVIALLPALERILRPLGLQASRRKLIPFKASRLR
jgi:hypothetical protein